MTTVNFIVYNISDYDEIYSKYFMNIGARIFIDFGCGNGRDTFFFLKNL